MCVIHVYANGIYSVHNVVLFCFVFEDVCVSLFIGMHLCTHTYIRLFVRVCVCVCGGGGVTFHRIYIWITRQYY